MKSTRVDENYTEAAADYLRQYSEYLLIQGVEGDYICGVCVGVSENLQRILYGRAVATSLFKTYDSEVQRPLHLIDSIESHRSFRRNALKLLSHLYDYARDPDTPDFDYITWPAELMARLSDTNPHSFLLRQCLLQGHTGGRWNYPMEMVREFKGQPMPVRDLVYDVMEATILARPDHRERFYMGDTFHLTSDMPGAKFYDLGYAWKVGFYWEYNDDERVVAMKDLAERRLETLHADLTAKGYDLEALDSFD